MTTGAKMRRTVSITISPDLVKWLDLEIKKGKFSSRSDGIEHAVNYVRKSKHLPNS